MPTSSDERHGKAYQVAHDFAARWAVRAMLKARQGRDPELAGLYEKLAAAHVDRHIAWMRQL